MKMYMPLVASEDGIVQFVKQPGVSLEPGDILGILTLDDPARVKHAKPFEGLLPPMGAPGVVGNKSHQRLARCLGVLNDILDGFDNQAIMSATLKDLIEVLHDHDLPYTETVAILSTLSGRMPQRLEEAVRAAIDAAKTKGVGHEFPAVRVKKVVQHYISDNVLPADTAMFKTQLGALYGVLERFSEGLKGHEVNVIADLLERYCATESLFGGSIEARVLALREQHRDDLDKVVALVLSHIKAQSKAKLVLALMEHIQSSGLPISNAESRLSKVLSALTALEAKYALLDILPCCADICGRSSTAVTLKAREVLILGQMPSYEDRSVQMEKVLKNSVTSSVYGEQRSGPRFAFHSLVLTRGLTLSSGCHLQRS
jgi:acetyl-CoA carboxylase/biotin carboxylase 1